MRSLNLSIRAKAGFLAVAVGLVVAACGGSDTATPAPAPVETPTPEAEAPEEPFDLTGSTLEIVVQYSPGGGFDLQARELARIISEDYGIRTVVINDTGAGGLVALNNHAAASPDSLRILYIQTPAALASQIGEAEGVRYDLTTFPFLARSVADELLLVARTGSGFTSLDDILNAESPSFAATGPGGIDFLAGSVLRAVFTEANLRIVAGYDGQPATTAGMLRGDADLTASNVSAFTTFIADGEVVPIALIGTKRSAALPDVPLLSEIAPAGGPDRALVLESLAGLAEAGRTIAAVPGTPEPQLAALRALIEEVVQKDAFTEFLTGTKSIPGFTPGVEMGERITSIVNTGGIFAEVLRAAAKG